LPSQENYSRDTYIQHNEI